MRVLNTWILLALATLWSSTTRAQLQLVPDKELQLMFAGNAQKISVVWHNTGNKTADAYICARIFQTSSATLVQLGEVPWKKLQVLPQQTILESAWLDFPDVKEETKFLVQWLENTNHVLGVTEVLIYPTNLLSELRPLAEDQPIGIFDPQDEIKPLLNNLRIEFDDLGNSGITNFSGKLAIIGPFRAEAQAPDDLREQIKSRAKRGAAIVWIQPPEKHHKLKPSFYSVPEKQVAVVIVQPGLVSDLSENPQSQLNLVYFCKLALNPQPSALPDLTAQP